MNKTRTQEFQFTPQWNLQRITYGQRLSNVQCDRGYPPGRTAFLRCLRRKHFRKWQNCNCEICIKCNKKIQKGNFEILLIRRQLRNQPFSAVWPISWNAHPTGAGRGRAGSAARVQPVRGWRVERVKDRLVNGRGRRVRGAVAWSPASKKLVTWITLFR